MLKAFGQIGAILKISIWENSVALWLYTPENNFADLWLHTPENFHFVTLLTCVLCEVKHTRSVKKQVLTLFFFNRIKTLAYQSYK